MPEPKFDKSKVADLAQRIEAAITEVEECQTASNKADRELRHAQTTLANLRSELTRAVDGQLDMQTLKQKAPQSHMVTP